MKNDDDGSILDDIGGPSGCKPIPEIGDEVRAIFDAGLSSMIDDWSSAHPSSQVFWQSCERCLGRFSAPGPFGGICLACHMKAQGAMQ